MSTPRVGVPSSVLVTGGAGFIGSHLVERLLAAGNAVVVIDDFSTGSLENLRAVLGHPKLRLIQSNISDCPELLELVSQVGSIYHLAAVVGVDLVIQSPLRTVESNVHETNLLLKFAAARRVPLLLTSTSEVYGRTRKTQAEEEDELLIGSPENGRWGYACSKLLNEFMALAYAQERSLPVVVTRLFNTVGPRQTGRFGMVMPRFIEAARCGEPLKVFGDGSQTRSFCYVSDAVEALIRLQNCPTAHGQIFNVGSTEEISILDLAKAVIEILGSKSGIEFVPYDQAYVRAFEDVRHRRPSVDKLAAAVGFRPMTSLREIILRTAAWIEKRKEAEAHARLNCSVRRAAVRQPRRASATPPSSR